MTREEERINCATAYANEATDGIQDVYFDIVMKTHLDATKWADRTMIDKACKWLCNNLCYYDENDFNINGDGMLKHFKEAMEE